MGFAISRRNLHFGRFREQIQNKSLRTTPMFSENCRISSRGLYFFEDDRGTATTVNAENSLETLTVFFLSELEPYARPTIKPISSTAEPGLGSVRPRF